MFTFPDAYLSLAQLEAIPVPETARWAARAHHSRWQPIQHGELRREPGLRHLPVLHVASEHLESVEERKKNRKKEKETLRKVDST